MVTDGLLKEVNCWHYFGKEEHNRKTVGPFEITSQEALLQTRCQCDEAEWRGPELSFCEGWKVSAQPALCHGEALVMPSCTRRLLESQEPFIQLPEPHWLGIAGCQMLGPQHGPYSWDCSSPRGTGMFTDNVRIGGNAGTAQPPALRDHRAGANHTALRNISPIKGERGLPPPSLERNKWDLDKENGSCVKQSGISSKSWTELTMWPSKTTPGYTLKRNENVCTNTSKKKKKK